MRTRFTSLVVVGAILFALPLTVRSQTDTALKVSSSNARAVAEFRAGVSDLQNISFESAASHFKAAIDADPNFGLARVLYASTTGELTPAQVTAEVNRGVDDAKSHGTTNELTLALAYREAALNHAEPMKVFFRTASQLMPSDRLAAFMAAGGIFATTLPDMQEFVKRYPDYPVGYNSLAYLSWFGGDRAGALAAAKRQVELNPNAPNPHDTYAEVLQWNGNFAEATAHYKQAASLSPRFPEAYAGLAEVAALQGQYDQARAYLNQAIANAWTPSQKLSYMRQIAGTYALEGSAASLATQLDAVANEAKAQKNLQTAAIAYAQLAATQANAGNTSAAHQSLAMARAASPDVPWAVYFYGAMSHAMLKHWGPAGHELALLKEKAAADASVSADMVAAADGFQLTQQGKPADALRVLMAADTTNPLVMNRIAEAHAALGHTAEAATWNARVTSNYALNLADYPSVNARRRARGTGTAAAKQ
jgi:tetratricopeptide (TPR) repeat protein